MARGGHQKARNGVGMVSLPAYCPRPFQPLPEPLLALSSLAGPVPRPAAEKCIFEKTHTRGPHRALGYSLRTLYFNSSSSRASGFLWITRFFFLLTGVCVPPKDVGGWVFLLHSEMNNLAQWRGSVDNRLVAPEGCTGLSTGPGMRVATRQRHPAWTGWFVYGK